MMFINTYIQLMEAATILLLGLLTFQVYRCYRNFYRELNVATLLQQDSQDESVPILITNTSKVTNAPVSDISLVSNSSSGQISKTSNKSSNSRLNQTESILTDYIGNFFTETPKPKVDIQDFRAQKVINSVGKEKITDDIIETISESNDDDSVILVMSAKSSATVEGSNQIMSDKVVHAMLDEANLVCVS